MKKISNKFHQEVNYNDFGDLISTINPYNRGSLD